MNNKEIKIVLVDDHELVLEGFKMLLMPHPDFVVAGEADSGKELKNLLQTVVPDIILMDIKLPGESGIDLCRYVKSIYPKVK